MRIPSAGRGAIAAVAITFLFLTLCGAQRVQAQAQAPAQAQTQVKLAYKFPEGKTLKYRMTSNVFQTQTLGGMEIQSRENKTVVWAQTTGKRRKDSSLPVEVKVESLRASVRLQGGIDLNFDSAKPDAKFDSEYAPLFEMYKLESQGAYTVVLGDHDTVKAIEGTEKLQEKASRLDPISREQIRHLIEADRLKSRFEQEHPNLPDAPAKPGESWERTETMDFGGGQTLTFRKKYEYTGSEKKGGKTLDKITSKVLEVKCQPDPKAQSPLKVTKSNLKLDSSDGTILFDREAGCLVESRERTKVQGSMTLTGGGTDITTKLELTLQSNTQLQAPAK